ncbi:MAG: LuxR C-terminal-related transcriptional regulator [Candidatus Promineifilaceae bacterium]|nr:LuxR C-terminal-related transcriptional regulator [Candidatus Promineifilaceae bacterium]
MSEPLLQTKLRIPHARPDLVSRPRLFSALDAGLGADPQQWAHKITLISAPAGFGKTTLLAAWLRRKDKRPPAAAAWLSLDNDDDDLARFLAYFTAALQQVDEAIGRNLAMGQDLSGLGKSLQPPSADQLLPPFINDIAAAPPLIIVLDDVHLLDNAHIHKLLALLVQYQPSHLHLILAGRGRPSWLPLARLRARGNVTEIGAQDLRFTREESAAFLADLDLSEADLAALEKRTEGWIAGLQLAALALPGRGEQEQFIRVFARSFAGNDRYLADYLADEVLRQLEPATQRFLLHTAILDQMCAALCNAVSGRDDGQRLLEKLERDGLFVTPLDNERRWYRYHRLFAQYLRHRLRREQPEILPRLHRRTSRWYAEREMAHAAVRHALAIGAPEEALALIDRYDAWLFRRGEIGTLIEWLRPIPLGMLTERPGLALSLAWAWFIQGEANTAAELVETIASYVTAEDDGELFALRTALARQRGDWQAVRTWAERALDELDEGTALYGVVNLYLSDLLPGEGLAGEAKSRLTATRKLFRNLERPYLETQALYRLINLHAVRGELHQAAALCEEAFAIMVRHRLPYVVGGFHFQLGQIHWEWNQLDRAARRLQEGIEIGRRGGHVPMLAANTLLLARIQAARGEAKEAEALLGEARALAIDSPPAAERLVAWEAWTALRRGQTEPAVRWAAERDLSPADEPDYHTLDDYVLLLHLLIEQDDWAAARPLLERALQVAERGDVRGVRLQLLLYLAQHHAVEGRMAVATRTVERALALGEPGAYVRRFADEARPLLGILAHLRVHYLPRAASYSRAYLEQVLAAFGDEAVADAPGPAALAERFRLDETLSRRELEILQLLGRGLSNPQIAEKLHISVGTVRWHVKNVYRKLDVNNRVQATVRAQTIGLLP